MKRIIYSVVILLAVILATPKIFAGYSWKPVKISRVLNSNTFITKGGEKSRIIGVLPNNEFSGDKREVCHAKGNILKIKSLLLNNEIFSAADEKVKNALHLKINTEYVTEILLKKGLAKMNNDKVSSFFLERFKKAQDFAKNKKIGVWGPCVDDINRQKISDNFGGRMRNFKKDNSVFMGNMAIGEVERIVSGNELKLKNGPKIILNNVKIPLGTNLASTCFRENSRNYLENLLLGKKIRIEKVINSKDIENYKLIRKVFLNPKSREISINKKIIAEGFGKYSQTSISNSKDLELSKIQQEVYKNPRGAWLICAKEILNTDFSENSKVSREIDENCPIKGNISGTKSNPIKTYHTVKSGWYDRIKYEKCFNTENEANFAGFRKIK